MVGIVGEYYTIMEPFSNHYIEKELAQGIVVDRWMNVSNSLLHRPVKKLESISRIMQNMIWVLLVCTL